MSVHPVAARGFALAAEAYGRGRPGYPPEVDAWLSDAIGLSSGCTALDLGAGTGKFTPHLLATGAAATAVEPVAEMREALAAASPEVRVLAGSAEAILADDGAFDAVICAQAFHWFATPEALAEIRRVLRPGGALGLVWNVRDETVGWVRALNQILQPYEGEVTRFGSGHWRRVFPAQGFTPLVETGFASGHRGPVERVVLDRVLSTSFIAALAEDEREKVTERVRRLIRDTPALSAGGEVVFPYVAQAYSSRRT